MNTDVRGASNAIVAAVPEIDVEDLQEQIEDALEKRAERLARRIEVRAWHDIVTVQGTVHSLAEKEAVLGVIRSTPGVRRIADQLWVDAARQQPRRTTGSDE